MKNQCLFYILYKRSCIPTSCYLFYRAGDEARTRDLQLGRLSLYQLSYSRNLKTTFKSLNVGKLLLPNSAILWAQEDSNLRSRKTADLQSAHVGRLWNVPSLVKSQKFTPKSVNLRNLKRATCRNRTSDLLITNQLLYHLS